MGRLNKPIKIRNYIRNIDVTIIIIITEKYLSSTGKWPSFSLHHADAAINRSRQKYPPHKTYMAFEKGICTNL